MKYTLLALSFLVSSFGIAQNNNISLDSLQGAWSCVYSVYDNPMLNHDEMPPYDLDSPDMIWIEHDTLFELNYPCYMNAAYKISIRHDTLSEVINAHEKSKAPPAVFDGLNKFPARVWLDNDTLSCMTGRYGGFYTEKIYIRTTVDPAQISLLRKNRIDLKCITGQWNLETTYDSGYDGNGIVEYDFPFQPQHVILFTTGSRSNYSSNTLWLKADGVARPFKIVSISSDGTILEVQTMGWYKSSWPWTLHYRKEE